MSLQTRSWESRLLALAQEGSRGRPCPEDPDAGRESLQRAYRHCAEITRTHSRTFYLASSLLPAPKRQAVRALYAFCRVTDDIIDRFSGDPRPLLDTWRNEVALGVADGPWAPVILAWSDTRARYCIPELYAEQLIDGVAHDLSVTRYDSFESLAAYCYGAASTVGLMAMHIVGFDTPAAMPYAIKLGVALQLTNILRDVGEDWRAGRLYLPGEELHQFGLSEEDVAQGRLDGDWRAFIEFQIARNRRLYSESLPGIPMLHRDGRFAIAAAAELYRGILDDIEGHEGDVFRRRAYVSGWGKLRRLPGIWLRASAGGYPAA